MPLDCCVDLFHAALKRTAQSLRRDKDMVKEQVR